MGIGPALPLIEPVNEIKRVVNTCRSFLRRDCPLENRMN